MGETKIFAKSYFEISFRYFNTFNVEKKLHGMYCFVERGHSTTTWTRTRREGEGVNKQSTLVHPRGGSLDVHVDKILKKWQMTMKSQDWVKIGPRSS